MLPAHGIRFDQTRFWVVHRRREYGPFDYEWSADMYGIEFTYLGRKFGEYCSDVEIFADLKEFELPATVVEVASIAIGCVVYGLIHGLPEHKREVLLFERLKSHGHEKFSDFRSGHDVA